VTRLPMQLQPNKEPSESGSHPQRITAPAIYATAHKILAFLIRRSV
jgi:hypothetical protein